MISLAELKATTRAALKGINALLPQLSSSAKKLSYKELQKIVRSPSVHCMILRDGKRIIGVGSLITMNTLLGLRARIEDVVVDEAYRDRGLGKQLLDALVEAARGAGALNVELSSRPERERANALYRSSGFVQRKTNVYRLAL